MRWDLVLERRSRNRLNPEITRKKLRKIAEAASRNRSLGFRGRVGKLSEPELIVDEESKDEVHRYLVRLRLEKAVVRNPEAAQKQFDHIMNVISRCAANEGWRVLNERVKAVEGESVSEQVNEPRPEFVVPRLTEEVLAVHFHGIYERDEQIRTIHDAVETMVETDGKVTNHQLLYGLWGSCKTVLMERFKAWYEADNQKVQRVAFVDGTTMSKAGLENWLLDLADADQLPDVLVVDELEKQATENLSVLNGIMGSGVLAKLNARISNRRRTVRIMVVGICNDLDQLKKNSLGNALLSRFGDPVYCPRPSRELALRILTDMVSAFPGGDPEWAVKAVEFGWDELGQRDIRKLKKHLSARHRLMDGSYQRDQIKMLTAQQREQAALLKEEKAKNMTWTQVQNELLASSIR